ncbi:MAG: nucleotidyltransferase domain-containing protein [Nanoarchaeota archaeon]|nr:nucleotidyltransferase domain-containing protein [Nanoarchaeota archaeon]
MVKPKIDPKIFQKYGVKIAYLFGSRAKDFAAPESDFDIGVLFKEDGSDLFDKSMRLGMELQKFFPAEVDVRVLNNAPSLFKYEVISANLPLYSEDERERIDFEVRCAKEYIDDQYIRDIYFQAVKDKINRGVFQ